MKKIDIETKRTKEIIVVCKMIEIYCKKNHHQRTLCDDCKSLMSYATLKTRNCKLMQTKTFCSKCKVHCYSNKEKEQIRQVMKFSGKYMLLYHPILTIKHFIT